MAQEFKNKYALNVGTSFVELYGPSGDMTYSIITGMTISNKKLNEILVTVRIIDSTNLTTAYLCSDSKLSVGSTLLLAGDLQKIVLKPGDTIEISSNESASVDVTMAVMENDPSISYGGAVGALWYGDFAFVTAGESGYNNVSSYVFSSGTAIANIGSITWNITAAGGASNGIIGLLLGGYSSERNTAHAFDYASKTWTDTWSTLWLRRRLFEAASNTINYIMFGGYSGSTYYNADVGDFLQGSVTSVWGDLYGSYSYYTGAASNSIYALMIGGYQQGDDAQYFLWASQGAGVFWGNIGYSYYGWGAGSNEERVIVSGASSSSSNIVRSFDFASQGDAVMWGSLSYSNSEMGGVSSGVNVLFTCGENYSYSEMSDFASGVTTTRVNGLYTFDGGNPVSESGNG